MQPVLSTLQKQTKLWTDLILDYCQHNKLYKLDLDHVEKLPLFKNDSIKSILFINYFHKKIGSLNRDAIMVFLDAIVKQGRGEWIDKNSLYVYWKTPNEWADIILKWASEMGHANSVLTVYELLEGDTGEKTEFYGLDGGLFRKAIGILQKRGKAELFQGTTFEEDGVKFLNV